VYCSTETKTYTTPTPSCTTSYIIPGPTVWSGAWVDTTKVNVPPAAAPTTHVPWSTWIVNSVVTSATYVDKAAPTVVGTSVYTASWGTVYETPVVGGRW
jgi:cellulase